ncbi:DUF2478 domain-containing protein [Donghicola eburneus]|uniref:3-dehydroquinate dehydratase n=1 Tax=Donghicola eburneus TaxID=393278 RepID=A0A1M4N064_9RHOB|nr:DUF2478 domain-containing protein [Donghicola eburneus]SCM67414.1 3-dehydroquinate dehydratase [Donghicola eburneus]SFQ03933.1 Protein of unknown function [Donghicola eburneus]
MLGYVVGLGRGDADRCLVKVSEMLREAGVSMAGAVQFNIETDPAYKCQMDLHILTGADVVRISQDLGTLSQGCRLDPEGLERAVGLVASALEADPQVMILNKFGKQELDGRGFRPVIGEALGRGIPVLTAVAPGNVEGFRAFADDFGQELPAEPETVMDWVRTQIDG